MQGSLKKHSVVLPLFLLLLHGIHALSQKANKTVPALIVFGDSVVDPGNNNAIKTLIKCNYPPYGQDFPQRRPTGRFSNGKIPGDLLAEKLGIKDLLPAYYDPNLTSEDLLTGVSFASGGAGYDSLTSKLTSAISLSDQLKLFMEYKEKIKAIAGEERAARIVSDSVYITIVGTNDIVNTYYTTPFRRAYYDLPSYVELIVKAASSFYQDLHKLGARKIGIVGLSPLGCIPLQRTLGGGMARDCDETRNQAAILVNNRLSQEIDKLQSQLPGALLVYIDGYSILNDIIQHPAKYGFEVSDRGCCGTGLVEVLILCNPLTPVSKDVSKYVFWDSYHPTERAYRILFDKGSEKFLPILS